MKTIIYRTAGLLLAALLTCLVTIPTLGDLWAGASTVSDQAIYFSEDDVTIPGDSVDVVVPLNREEGYRYDHGDAASGHTYQVQVINPSCTEGGYTLHECEVCAQCYTTDVLPATGHSYEVAVTAPGCTEGGYTCHTCALCGDSYRTDETAALGHRYQTVSVAATCIRDGSVTESCEQCGDVKIQVLPATGHDYRTVTVAATCTTDGSVTTTCAVCGDTQTEVLAATGHSYAVTVVAPTCTTDGYTEHVCGCGDRYVSDELPATGHSFTGGICTACHACQACGQCQWTPITDSQLDAFGRLDMPPGHYILTEDVSTSQKQLNSEGTTSGTYCVDLAGYIFLGDIRAFLVYEGAVLNIYDSVGGGAVEGQGSAAVSGGALYVTQNGEINLYSGIVRRNNSNSDSASAAGAVHISGGLFRMYGGTVLGAKASKVGGTIYAVSRDGVPAKFIAAGGQVTAGEAATGDCVYIADGCFVELSGDAMIDEIYFVSGSAETLTVSGDYCGGTTLTYSGSVDLTEGTVLGSICPEGELSEAGISIGKVSCKQLSVGDTQLTVVDCHHYQGTVTAPTCIAAGYTTYTCSDCGHSYIGDEMPVVAHSYENVTVDATCTVEGSIVITCAVCGDTKSAVIPAPGHRFENGTCTVCGDKDPDFVTVPALTLKSPALEFKDMIKVIAFFTAENTEDVVEMGMVTYTESVDVFDVNTAAHVIPGAEYEAGSGRYYASSQGINAKYLADTVYLACYAKLTDGSYVYTKLAPYSPITYATNQLKNSTNNELKQLVAAMLNYGAAAQMYFNYNVENLANASLTAEQLALPDSYREDMVSTVPAADASKQGVFANNKGFSLRKPAVSFEGAFSINYFFTPAYAPVDGITLYYWTEADFNAVEELTVDNATGSLKMTPADGGQYRGDITGIAAKNIAQAVYVAAVYSDGTTTWTSGVLGYSIGAYCSSLATKGGTAADLAMATAVYGYHAKAYFG